MVEHVQHPKHGIIPKWEGLLGGRLRPVYLWHGRRFEGGESGGGRGRGAAQWRCSCEGVDLGERPKRELHRVDPVGRGVWSSERASSHQRRSKVAAPALALYPPLCLRAAFFLLFHILSFLPCSRLAGALLSPSVVSPSCLPDLCLALRFSLGRLLLR